MSLREKFTEDMKQAMRDRNEVGLSTLRLIIAAIKDKDIAARTAESREGIRDEQILSLLQAMVKQRRESIRLYEQGGRPELAAREAAEITVIESYLPRELPEDEMKAVIQKVIAATGASGVRDMGKVMAELKAKYSGQMDFSKVGGLVKEKLAGPV